MTSTPSSRKRILKHVQKVVLLFLSVGTVQSAFAQRVYLNGGTQMWRADLGGGQVERLIRTEFINPRGLAVDPDAGKIYAADRAGHGRILRANVDGTQVEDVYAPGTSIRPSGVALDVTHGKVYWAITSSPRKIQRTNLDGSNVEDLVLIAGGMPQAIAIDFDAEKLYWTDSQQRTISRSDLDGRNVEVVVSGLTSVAGLAIDEKQRTMYWTGSGKIERTDLDGSNRLIVLATPGGAPLNIELDVAAGKMYWMEGFSDAIMRANLDGTEVEEVLAIEINVVFPWGLALDLSAGKLYWSDDTRIMQANLNGTDREGVIVTVEPRPGEVALDLDDGKMYWAEGFNANRIRRSNLDGSDVEDLVHTAPLDAFGIALDLTAEKMYWTERGELSFTGEGWIRRANLDGTDIENVVGGSDFGWPTALALDLTGGKVYWVWNFYSIGRANLDGTQIEFAAAGGESKGIAIDEVSREIYWGAVDFDSCFPSVCPELWRIRRADLNLTNVVDILTWVFPEGLALDLFEPKFYFVTGRQVGRTNLDGSEPELVTTIPEGQLLGLALDTRIPGDCDENHVVTLSDHQSFIDCLTGPNGDFAWSCSCADENGDRDVDLADFAPLQRLFAGKK